VTPTELAEAVATPDPVRHWRLEVLIQAGYQPWDALVLSRRRDIDLHAAIGLLERGCSPVTAMRILL
jgi:hypothetical protein